MRSINKYLQRYAEAEVTSLSQFPTSFRFSNTLVIPAYQEDDAFFQRLLKSSLSQCPVLYILVINQPDSETDSTLQFNLSQTISSSGKLVWQHLNLSLVQPDKISASILLVDRFSTNQTIDNKQGVGLARKIGSDLATALIHSKQIDCPWICSSDADAHLPDNYFSVLASVVENTSAIIYDFNHTDVKNDLSDATQLYEQALRYYVAGLQWAGSSYGFHTIGSTLCFRYDYYVLVRGFPKRSAGEDFYLLNKLAKLAPVRTLNAATGNNATIKIDARVSHRVPFGTGPAVSKILTLNNPSQDYLYYDPQLFVELSRSLKALNKLWLYLDDTESWFQTLSEPARYGFEKLPFHKLIKHLQSHGVDKQGCDSQIFQWFDAFRTLKFIHYLQEKYHPPIPLQKAIFNAPFEVKPE